MKLFESVKAAVPLRQAAEHYGLRVLRNGMTCCPFHKDRHPSLKLNEDYFFCFGCGASGDVIDFTARLFGISLKDATEKLAADFGISADAKPVAVRRRPTQRSHTVSALMADGSIAFWETAVAENRKEERHRANEPEIA